MVSLLKEFDYIACSIICFKYYRCHAASPSNHSEMSRKHSFLLGNKFHREYQDQKCQGMTELRRFVARMCRRPISSKIKTIAALKENEKKNAMLNQQRKQQSCEWGRKELCKDWVSIAIPSKQAFASIPLVSLPFALWRRTKNVFCSYLLPTLLLRLSACYTLMWRGCCKQWKRRKTKMKLQTPALMNHITTLMWRCRTEMREKDLMLLARNWEKKKSNEQIERLPQWPTKQSSLSVQRGINRSHKCLTVILIQKQE